MSLSSHSQVPPPMTLLSLGISDVCQINQIYANLSKVDRYSGEIWKCCWLRLSGMLSGIKVGFDIIVESCLFDQCRNIDWNKTAF